MADVPFYVGLFLHHKMQKNYSENPAYYKRLIAQINTEADFAAYLQHLGYKLLKKSVGSLEFKNGEDRIVLNIARNPVTYFNRNDSADKGLFFKFIRKQNDNFYRAVKAGLEVIDRSYALDETTFEVKRNRAPSKSLEENYNIVPLQKTDYLVQNRTISPKVLEDELFQGRIFNAFHIRDNGGKIGNIAFPKYDLDGNPKNYILYNKTYFDRRENKRKKFRLTLNKNDRYLFYSKPISNPEHIVLGESAIDLLSYHELHGSPKNFYISFGGNIYAEKLEFFAKLIEPFLENEKIQLISAMDNDKAGRESDLKVLPTLINQCSSKVHIEYSLKRGRVNLAMHYVEGHRTQISLDKSAIDETLKSSFMKNNPSLNSVRTAAFSDKLVLEFSLEELANTFQTVDNSKNTFKTLLEFIGNLYLPYKLKIQKSKGKDWNDDLMEYKNAKFMAMTRVLPMKMAVGDKIELKNGPGPEGNKNQGIIVRIKQNGMECDFGTNHTYHIPFTAIKIHYKKIGVNNTKSTRNTIKKKSNKNSKLSIS